MRQFGCDAYALIPDVLRKKWDSKSKKLILIGYEHESDNYRLFDPKTARVIISRNVIFNEDSPRNEVKNDIHLRVIDDSRDTVRDPGEGHDDDQAGALEHQGQIPEPSQSLIPRRPGVRNEVDAPFANEDEISHNARIDLEPYNLRARNSLRRPERYNACLVFDDAPTSYKEALNRVDSPLWKRAIDEELDAHAKNKSWEVVNIPEGRKPVGFKWVFKIKRSPGGDAQGYKARLCAQSFAQQAEVDYDEIFSPVVRFESVRVLLAIAAQENLEALQFDVSTAYLNSDLCETVYMRIPDGD